MPENTLLWWTKHIRLLLMEFMLQICEWVTSHAHKHTQKKLCRELNRLMWYKWLRDCHLSWDFVDTGFYISLFKKHSIYYFSHLKISVAFTFGNLKRFRASVSSPVEFLESVSFFKVWSEIGGNALMRSVCYLNVFRKLSFHPLLSGCTIIEFHLALISLLLRVIDNDFLTGREVIQNACLSCNWNLWKWLAS